MTDELHGSEIAERAGEERRGGKREWRERREGERREGERRQTESGSRPCRGGRVMKALVMAVAPIRC